MVYTIVTMGNTPSSPSAPSPHDSPTSPISHVNHTPAQTAHKPIPIKKLIIADETPVGSVLHPGESFNASSVLKDTFQKLAIEEQSDRLLFRNSNKISCVMDGLQPLLSKQTATQGNIM